MSRLMGDYSSPATWRNKYLWPALLWGLVVFFVASAFISPDSLGLPEPAFTRWLLLGVGLFVGAINLRGSSQIVWLEVGEEALFLSNGLTVRVVPFQSLRSVTLIAAPRTGAQKIEIRYMDEGDRERTAIVFPERQPITGALVHPDLVPYLEALVPSVVTSGDEIR